MANNPLISIVVPVYNVSKYLPLSVESVLSQSYDNYELILVDDGSPDDCPQICDKYAESYQQVRVIHKNNEGLGLARNTGLDYAKGDYVLFMDSDDLIHPNTLSRFIDVLNTEGEMSLIVGGFQMVDEKNRAKFTYQDNGYQVFLDKFELQRKFLTRKIVIMAPGTLYNTMWLRQNNLRFKKTPYSEDQLFLWESLLKVKRGAYIHDPLYNYLQRPGSIMSSSKLAKICESYQYFKNLNDSIIMSNDADNMVKKYMLARWSFGVFHSAAKLCSKKEYKNLLADFEAPKHIKSLKKFPDYKIRYIAAFYHLSSNWFYQVNKIL